ncbi:MAG TPA: hypothetical protein VN622_14535 [Clostridia bacterium]|nr:hypothetical protein [Clostridia bacterium]
MSSEFEDFKDAGGNDAKCIAGFVTAFRETVHAEASRPEWFWAAQRAQIRSSLGAYHGGSARWALASLLAILALGAAMLLAGPGKPSESVATAQPDPDDILMQQVVDATSAAMPDALLPASLLAQEVGKGFEAGGGRQ